MSDDDNIIDFTSAAKNEQTIKEEKIMCDAVAFIGSNPEGAGDFAIELMGQVIARTSNDEVTFDHLMTAYLGLVRRRAKEIRTELEKQQ